MDIRIEDMPAREVIYLRGVGIYSKTAPALWDELWAYVKDKGLEDDYVAAFGLCWDNPATGARETRRYDACMALESSCTVDFDAGIAVQKFEGGRYAVVRHKGPYKEIGGIFRHLVNEGLDDVGEDYDDSRPALENYFNDPNMVPPSDLITDICVPIK